MKKVVIFKDKVGYIDGPSMINTTLTIREKTGEVLEPIEEIKVEMPENEWKKLKKEENVKKVKTKLKKLK